MVLNPVKPKQVDICPYEINLPRFQETLTSPIALVYGPSHEQRVTLSIIEAEQLAEQILRAIAECSAQGDE